MRSARAWWIVYGAGVAVVLLALLWTSALVLRLESAECRARAEVDHQEALRSALWRMDSWLAPLLAREAARPHVDYQAFYPQEQAYTKLLSQIVPGEVLTPSPLLSFQSPYVALHFQLGQDGQVTSPQAPAGNARDLTEGAYLPPERLESNEEALGRVRVLLTNKADLDACVTSAESRVAGIAPLLPLEPTVAGEMEDAGRARESQQPQQQQDLRNSQEFTQRQASMAQWAAEPATAIADSLTVRGQDVNAVQVGPLVPLWVGGGPGEESGEPELVFMRRVCCGPAETFQGFLCDWPALRASLLEQVMDLFVQAQLVPVNGGTEASPEHGRRLATIPAALIVPDPLGVPLPLQTAARSTLAITWLIVLIGCVAVALALRASIDFGRRRSRFASAVTHELRTPLTTFRLYTDMLAEGMVSDETKKREYIDTLRSESTRLSSLVENVLAYARLEDGRRVVHAERTSVGALLDRLAPPLRRRAREGGMDLVVLCPAPAEAALDTDVDAVGQILFNLVDNACKYAHEGHDRRIELEASLDNGSLCLDVSDHGPGIAPDHERSIFVAFERGAHDQGTKPGIGLGLALARGLARDLSGDLRLIPCERGARFRLTVPVAR